MDQRAFRQEVLAGKTLLGTFLNLGSAMTTEIAGRVGFDWLLLDHEHGPGGEETLMHQLWAAGTAGKPAIVRIAWNDPVRIKRALDIGPAGLMLPMVNSPAEAEAAVSAVRYPPRGMRGVSKFNRSNAFAADFPRNFATGHEMFTTVVQIETPAAVAAADAMAAIDGVDVLFIGPVDLSTNLGCPDQLDHPDMIAARKAVVTAARKHDKSAGILLHDPARMGATVEEGFRFIAIGSDGGAVSSGLRALLAKGRDELAAADRKK